MLRGVLILIVFITAGFASASDDVSRCTVRLLSPETIQKYAKNFLAKTAKVMESSSELSEAASLTRELIERAQAGDIEVKVVEKLASNFDLRVGYPATLDGIRPTIRSLALSVKAADSLLRFATKGTVAVDTELVRDWIFAIAEVYPELEYERGQITLEDVNIYAALETKTRWLQAAAELLGGESFESLDDEDSAKLMWPAISRALREGEFRKVIAWLGLAHFNRVGGDPQALTRELERPRLLTGNMSFRDRFMDLGVQVGNLFAAKLLVEEEAIAAVFDVTPEQAARLHDLARIRVKQIETVLRRLLDP